MQRPLKLKNHFGRGAFFQVKVAVVCMVLGLATAYSASSSKNPALLEDYIRQLEASYREVQTVRAEFIQTYTWGSRHRVESGTVYLARGGLMRWDYREPQAKLFLCDGKKLLLYVPAESQLTRSSVKTSEDARVPFRLLLSRLNLRKVFSRIEFADQSPEGESPNRVLRGFPKEGADYHEVLMELNPELDIRRLVVVYPDQSTMEFRFDSIQRNIRLGPALFRFNPPAGTEVIERP